MINLFAAWIGFLNLAFVSTFHLLEIKPSPLIPSFLLIVGDVTIPLVCYLSAWKPLFRHFFFIPVHQLEEIYAIRHQLFSIPNNRQRTA